MMSLCFDLLHFKIYVNQKFNVLLTTFLDTISIGLFEFVTDKILSVNAKVYLILKILFYNTILC